MAIGTQAVLFDDPSIPGLAYLPEYIDQRQEEDLIRTIDVRPWITELKRRVQHYGYRYDYKARSVTNASRLGALPESEIITTAGAA